MGFGEDGEDRVAVGGRVLGRFDSHPLGEALGQMQQQVEHAFAAHRLLQQPGQFGADARQGLERCLQNRGYGADRVVHARLYATPMTETELSPRRRRMIFRAHHRGTKEADLMVGRFVSRHIADFTEAELDELEAVLDYQDTDLTDWLTGRLPIPDSHACPMLARMAAECAEPGAGMPNAC